MEYSETERDAAEGKRDEDDSRYGFPLAKQDAVPSTSHGHITRQQVQEIPGDPSST